MIDKIFLDCYPTIGDFLDECEKVGYFDCYSGDFEFKLIKKGLQELSKNRKTMLEWMKEL